MQINLVVDSTKIRELILDYLRGKLGDTAQLKLDDIKIKVRSRQNYREKEWENGEANYDQFSVDVWQKLLLAVMAKLDLDEVSVTSTDLDALNADMKQFIVADFRNDHCIKIMRTSERDAREFARRAGAKL